MLKKVLGILALSAIATMTWANVDLRTNIQDLYYRGSCEEAGAVTMSVNGDDFATASTVDPVFIRIRLDHNAKLCGSLVGNDGSLTYNAAHDEWDYDNTLLYSPIYLAMRLEGGRVYPDGSTDTLAAHEESVSIVRWLAGEGELWLRVQSSSANWIFDNSDPLNPGNTVSPSVVRGTVAWTFGTTARRTHTENLPLFMNDLANLPGNTRTPAWILDPADTVPAITTLFCVDMTESNLQAMPMSDSILAFDTISFKDTNQGWQDLDFDGHAAAAISPEFSLKYSPANGTVDKGSQTFVNFSGDDSVARGFDFTCTGGIVPITKRGPATAQLCAIRGEGQGVDNWGLVCMDNEVMIQTSCDDNQHGGWFNQSFVVLANLGDSDWGFRVRADGSLPAAWGHFSDGTPIYMTFPVAGTFGSYFIDSSPDYAGSLGLIWGVANHGGYNLGWAHQLFWFGVGHYGPKSLILHAEVCEYYLDDPCQVDMYVATYLRDHGMCDDDAPYDLDYQCLLCESSVLKVGEDQWYFGDFVDCHGLPVSIFFPYMPKLQETDFWTGMALVNHGAHDFDANGGLMGSIYEADGTNWKVTFPALPMKTMQTWLVMEGDQGVGFYGATGDPLTDGLFLQPTTTSNDLVFGDTRMNMFVTGTYKAEFFDEVGLGDLDGYCLIGQGTSINGSYLARNMYNEGVQHQDMPLVIGKGGDSAQLNHYVSELAKLVRDNPIR
jgi:hypothetical protein